MVLPWHLLGRTEKSHKNPVMIANLWLEIQTWDLPNMKQEFVLYVNYMTYHFNSGCHIYSFGNIKKYIGWSSQNTFLWHFCENVCKEQFHQKWFQDRDTLNYFKGHLFNPSVLMDISTLLIPGKGGYFIY